MARDILRTARIAKLAGETATRLNKFPRSQWSAGARSSLVARGLDGLNFGAGNVSSANSFRWQYLMRTAYPPPRFACVIGAARAPVDKSCLLLLQTPAMHPAASFSRRRVSQHDDRKSASTVIENLLIERQLPITLLPLNDFQRKNWSFNSSRLPIEYRYSPSVPVPASH